MIPIDKFIDEVARRMVGTLDQFQLERLRNVLIRSLQDCTIEDDATSIILYDGHNNEWYLKQFIVTKKSAGLADKTLKHYNQTLTAAFLKLQKDVTALTTDDIIGYLAMRDIEGNIKKTSLRNEYLIFSTFFNWLTAAEYIQKNPMLKVPKIIRRKQKKEAFSEMEIEKLRAACRNTWETCIIEVLLSTGCRVSELVQLRIDDVLDSEQCIITGKGMKQRTVFFNARAQLAIKQLVADRSDNNPFLFCAGKANACTSLNPKATTKNWYKDPANIAEGTVNIGAIERRIRTLAHLAGLPKGTAHPHKFRRTCATMALQRGMPLVQVSRMLGHEKLSTTQIYLDLNDEELKQYHKKFVV